MKNNRPPPSTSVIWYNLYLYSSYLILFLACYFVPVHELFSISIMITELANKTIYLFYQPASLKVNILLAN